MSYPTPQKWELQVASTKKKRALEAYPLAFQISTKKRELFPKWKQTSVISLNASLLSVLKFEGREGPVRLPLVTVTTKAVPRCPGVITPPPNIQGVFLRRECAKVWASRMLWEAVCSEVYYLKNV